MSAAVILDAGRHIAGLADSKLLSAPTDIGRPLFTPPGVPAPGWEPVWSATPSGAIVAHYLVVDDNPADPYRAEAFLPLWRPEKATRMNGYWLLGQLAAADGCFITLAEGSRVIYNRWYSFPATVRAHLAAMVGRLDSADAARDPDTFRQAMQWHMNNFDMDRLTVE